MKNHDEGVHIGASLDNLARQVSERWRQELSVLRVALDCQISSLETRLSERDHKPEIQTAIEQISQVAGERAEQARLQAETTAAQALANIEAEMHARLGAEMAANGTLRSALENAKRQAESAQATAATAEAARTATEAQHRQTLKENKKLTAVLNDAQTQLLDIHAQLTRARREAETNRTSLAEAQKQTQVLAAERAELQQRLKDLTTAKATAEAQYRELVTASHTLTDALSQMQRNRERVPAAAAVPPPPPLKAAVAPATAAKKPLQFSEPARDAKRVKIRRGIMVDIDGIPGELVDLSIGGAQTLLTQAVKSNQLVRLSLPDVDGELVCKGRIVWVVYEQPATSLSVYRTGVKFTDADKTAIEKFMLDFQDKPTMQHSTGSEDAARIS